MIPMRDGRHGTIFVPWEWLIQWLGRGSAGAVPAGAGATEPWGPPMLVGELDSTSQWSPDLRSE